MPHWLHKMELLWFSLQDMAPYVPKLMPKLKDALVDPLPEVRATAAKALGSLLKGMGEEYLQDILPYLMQKLKSEVRGVRQRQRLCSLYITQAAMIAAGGWQHWYSDCSPSVSAGAGSVTCCLLLGFAKVPLSACQLDLAPVPAVVHCRAQAWSAAVQPRAWQKCWLSWVPARWRRSCQTS